MKKFDSIHFEELITTFEMSADQQRAFQLFDDFVNSSEQRKVFVLSGYAGSGKSSVTAIFNSVMKKCGYQTRLMAPTGRAAKVLAQYCNQKAQTIHKEIYFGGNQLEDKSKLTVVKNNHKDTLFFVDEASMIASGQGVEEDLLIDLFAYVYNGMNCSLVLIGDSGQLPPVGQENSPALHLEVLKFNFPEIEIFSFHLKESFRTQKSSSILKNATFIRSKDAFIPPFICSLDQNTLSIKGHEVQESLEHSIQTKGIDNVVVLTLSNKQANDWNLGIRSRIFFREERMESGESLLVIKNNYYWINRETTLGFLANGEIIRVEKIIKEEPLYGFEFKTVNISFPLYADEPFREVVLLLDTLLIESSSLGRERMKALFYEVEKDYAHINNKQKRYSEVLNNPYFNAIHVKYGNALTVHKAQGGQWSDVYIDGSFIPEKMKETSYLRWLYTAVTRSKEQLYLVNFPAVFFDKPLKN